MESLKILLKIPAWWAMCFGIAFGSFASYASMAFQTKFLVTLDPTFNFQTLVIILGFACFNLLRKYENVEDIISQYDTYITEFSKEIGSIEKRLKDIDAKGTFEGDDEIGWFFKQIKVIQNRLSKFKIQ